MNVRTIGLSLYIMFIYWLSTHVPSMHMLFYPALGAFGFIFISRSLSFKQIGGIALGAVISSSIGTIGYMIYPGMISLFICMLITMWMIRTTKWNAPPILGVSLIPFITHAANPWTVPMSICISLIGLLAALGMVFIVERKMSDLPAAMRMKSGAGIRMDAEQ
ncbi:hypothetical protein [Paenibacillus sp. R14(2021)]|uniref:hypothetical protein n=1 Tax=Paenibacillus sp. R14(2021) TaxID=2859228 RepID=UPI001C6121EF|nr:hypothetical protein [Paenibacillus sp. R14(2021)]